MPTALGEVMSLARRIAGAARLAKVSVIRVLMLVALVASALVVGTPAQAQPTYSYTGSGQSILTRGYVPGLVFYADPRGDEVNYFRFVIPAGKTYTSAGLSYDHTAYEPTPPHIATLSLLSGEPSGDAAGMAAVRAGAVVGTFQVTSDRNIGIANLSAAVVTEMNRLSAAGGGSLYMGAHAPSTVPYLFAELNTVTLVGDTNEPRVTTLSPATGSPGGGNSVVITGRNFTGVTAVSFGGSPAVFAYNSSTQITATAPAGSGGMNVRVTTAAGTSATDAGNLYTYTALSLTTGAASGATVGAVYSQANTAGDGVAPYTYALSTGALPTGTSLNRNTGTVSGTLTAAGPYSYRIQVTDSQATPAAAIGATVAATIAKGTQTLNFTSTAPSATVGGPSYSLTATASSGLTAAYSLDGASTGCALAGNVVTFVGVGTCRINANQAGNGNWDAAVQVQQSFAVAQAGAIGLSVSYSSSVVSVGEAGTLTIRFTNNGGAMSPAFSTSLHSNAIVMTRFPGSGGTCAGWQSAVPSGDQVNFGNLSIPVGGCTITLPYQGRSAGTATFSVDGFTPAGYGSTATVVSDAVAVIPSVSSVSPTSGPAGATVMITGTGFSATPGANTVEFGGVAGTVQSASATSLSVVTPASGTGTVGVTVAVNGQTSSGGVTYTFLVPPIANDLSGVAVAYESAGTAIDLSGVISGGAHTAITIGTEPAHGSVSIAGDVVTYTPVAGYFGADSFTYTATGGGGISGSATVSVTVALPPSPVANGMTPSVSYGATNHAIALNLTGGPATSAEIVTGPSHGTATVVGLTLRYTPTAGFAGADSIEYRVTGPGGVSSSAIISITVDAATIIITPSSGDLGNGRPGQTFTRALGATGGTGPYSFAQTGGTMPPGLTVVGAAITGTPTSAGTFTFDVTATDSSTGDGPFDSAPATYSITVDPLIVVVGPTSAPAAATAQAYRLNITNSGGHGAVIYSVVGSLPPGLNLSGTGVLSGTPSSNGSYPFTVTVTDSLGFSGSQSYVLVVSDPVISVISPASGALPAGVGGKVYSPVVFQGQGGLGTHSFAVVSGSLPAGVTLSAAGVLSGTPTVAGSFNFTVAATDASPAPGPFVSADVAYSLEIVSPTITLTPAAGALPGGLRTVSYNQAITAAGGTGPYGYAVTIGALPVGLTLAVDGTLSGTPTAAGSHSFTVTATDAFGFNQSAAYTLEVGTPVAVVNPRTTEVVGGQSVTIDAAEGATGLDLIAAQIETPPSHGVATVSGLIITYTADGAYAGPDSFTYTVSNPGGVSAPATVTITVNPAVVAGPPKAVTILAGQTAVVELTEGAMGSPFTGATVVSVTPAGAGAATIVSRVAGGVQLYDLSFKPDNSFTGQAEVRYTLSNAFATSATGLVTITVEARPDPAQDPEVTGLVTAQGEAARRFATAQIGNINRRMEQLHDSNGRGGFSSSLSLSPGGFSGGMANDPSELRRMQDGLGVMGGVLGGRGAGLYGFEQVSFDPARQTEDVRSAGVGVEDGQGPWGVWVSGAATFGRVDDGADREGFKFNTDGLTIGVDRKLNEQWVLGGAVGWATDTSKIGSNGTRSEAGAWSLSLYGSWQPVEKAFIDVVMGYGRLDFDSRRFVTANGDFAYGQRDGDQWFGAITAGRDYRHPRGLHLSPYGRLEATRSTLGSFTEDGGGAFALAYGEQETETLTGAMGLRGDYAFKTGFGQVVPNFRIEYAYDLQGSGTQRIRYADWLDGAVYDLDASPLDRNRMLYGLGFDLMRKSGLRFGLDYEGMLSSDQTSSTLRMKLQTPF